MKKDTIKLLALRGMIWKLAEKISTQSISIVVQIILARLLLPEDYGLIGYLTVFINISEVFLSQGLTTALIQKKNADSLDFSSVFLANIILSVLIYIIFYFVAPYIAIFYNEPLLTDIMRTLSIMVIIGAFSAVHSAIMSKYLEFKKSFLRGLANTLTYAGVGVLLAHLGFGVWTLVYAKLAGAFVGTIVLCLTIKWRFVFKIDFFRIKSLFRFSSKVLGSNLLNVIFNNVNPLIIGKFYDSAMLGQYQRGQNIPHVIMSAIDGSMSEVMYPTLSELQDQIENLKSVLRRTMKLSMYIVFPMLVGILITARDFTIVFLTEKWLPSVPYMQLTCIICMFWPLSARTQALNSIGRSDVTFKLSFITKTLSLICLIAFAPISVTAIMLGEIVVSVLDLFISSVYIKKYIHYSLQELMMDILPTFLLSVVMGGILYCIRFLNFENVVILIIQILAGIVIYIAGSVIFKMESFEYLIKILKDLLGKSF